MVCALNTFSCENQVRASLALVSCLSKRLELTSHLSLSASDKSWTSQGQNASSCKSCFTMRWTDRRYIPVSREISRDDLLKPGWPSLLRMKSMTAMLSDVWTDRGRPVPLFRSALPVSSIRLIKSFKVLRFYCLAGNSFIILSIPHPSLTHNTRINALLSLVNGGMFIFTSTMSAVMSRRILITAQYLNVHFFSVFLFVYAVQVLKALLYANFHKVGWKVE